MSRETNIANVVTRIGTEFKTIRTEKADASHTHPASEITDFDTEVSNNTAVAANTAKVSADGSIGTHSDVDLTGLANGNLLAYNSSSGNFEPSTPGGGGDLLAANNLSDVDNVSTARSNLGVYSTTETDSAIATATAALVDSAPGALDTLNELAAAIGDDAAFSTTVTTALGNRLRFDASQTLTAPQLLQGQANLNVVDAADIGDTDRNFVTVFEAALL